MRNNLVIRKNKKGSGVYAGRPFRNKEVIHIFKGKVRTPKTLYYHGNNFRQAIIDPLQIGKDAYLELDSVSRLFNHSCEPNAGLRGRSTLFALQNIQKGEEITFDYSTTMDECFWCTCGSKKCRGVIYDFFTLPGRIRNLYYRSGALQDFIKKKYQKLLKGFCPCGSGKKYKKCHGA